MAYCAEYCLEMPEDFPIEELTQFMAIARRILLKLEKSSSWVEFGGAANLIGWRYRASFEYWQTYKYSLTKFTNPTHEELFQRERALFGMFSAGVSVLESTTYAIAALLSHTSILSLKFGPDEQRACTPRRLSVWLVQYPQAAELSGILKVLLDSNELSVWIDLRNRLTHRSNLPRIIHASVGAPLPVSKPIIFAKTSSTPPIDADIADFDALHQWLAKTLRELLVVTSKVASMLSTP